MLSTRAWPCASDDAPVCFGQQLCCHYCKTADMLHKQQLQIAFTAEYKVHCIVHVTMSLWQGQSCQIALEVSCSVETDFAQEVLNKMCSYTHWLAAVRQHCCCTYSCPKRERHMNMNHNVTYIKACSQHLQSLQAGSKKNRSHQHDVVTT